MSLTEEMKLIKHAVISNLFPKSHATKQILDQVLWILIETLQGDLQKEKFQFFKKSMVWEICFYLK